MGEFIIQMELFHQDKGFTVHSLTWQMFLISGGVMNRANCWPMFLGERKEFGGWGRWWMMDDWLSDKNLSSDR